MVGGLLLVFGLQWLRKAILRGAGLKAAARRGGDLPRGDRRGEGGGRPARRIRPYAFAISFKGVLLEGLEVVFIALTFGANQHRVGLAAAAAVAAVVVVAVAESPFTVRSRARPENAMKFGVGVMLDSFGIFWGAEGAGASGRVATPPCWRSCRPCSAFSLTLVRAFGTGVAPGARCRARMKAIGEFLAGGWEFVVGDDWVTALGVVGGARASPRS